jgi:hypothetical protein
MNWLDVTGIVTIVVLAAGLWVAGRLGRRFAYPVRPLPAFDRLQRTIQDAVEGGTGVHIGLGCGAMTQNEAGAGLQGLAFQRELARQISASDFPPVVSAGDATLAWMSAEVLAASSRTPGAQGEITAHEVCFRGGTPLATMAGILPPLLDRRISSAILGGHWSSEIAVLFGQNDLTEKISLAGSDDLDGQAVLYAVSPAALLGDEWFTSDAYLQHTRAAAGQYPQARNVAGLILMDIIRWVFCAVILTAVIARLTGLL